MSPSGEQGQTMAEYAVLLSVVVAALVLTFGAFGDAVFGLFQQAAGAIAAL